VDQAEAHFDLFRDSVNLVKDRCTVCVECTTGMEIILGTPDVLLGDVGQVQARFNLFGDNINLSAR
jgi:hypothetical protein